jgi:hypothetical protein
MAAIETIAARILEEHSKYAHKDMDWHKIAAAKVYEELRVAPQPTEEQPVERTVAHDDRIGHISGIILDEVDMSEDGAWDLAVRIDNEVIAHPPKPDVARLVEAGSLMRAALAEEVSALEVGDSETGQQQYSDLDAAHNMMDAMAHWDALQLDGTMDHAKATIPAVNAPPGTLTVDQVLDVISDWCGTPIAQNRECDTLCEALTAKARG